jgi:hypothetical protein
MPSDDTQERIITHGKHKSLRETRRRAAARDQPEMMDDIVKPGGSPRPRRQNAVSKTLREDAPATKNGAAAEAPRHNDQPNRAAATLRRSSSPNPRSSRVRKLRPDQPHLVTCPRISPAGFAAVWTLM